MDVPSVLIGAAVGAPFSVMAGIGIRMSADGKRRKIIARALLTELSWCEHALRALASSSAAAESGPRVLTPVYESFRGDIHLFKPDAARRLVLFHALVSDVRYGQEKRAGDETPASAARNEWVREKAFAAADQIPELARLLMDGAKAKSTREVTWRIARSDSKLRAPFFDQ